MAPERHRAPRGIHQSEGNKPELFLQQDALALPDHSANIVQNGSENTASVIQQ